MTSKPKQKGNGWERQLCGILAETFGGNFQRVPNSGAFTGGFNTFRKDFLDATQNRIFKGDIIPAEFLPKLVIECKFYADLQFHRLLREDNKQIDGWLEQTIISADKGDIWFLCIKLNNKGAFVMFDEKYINDFKLANHFRYKTYIMTDLLPFLKDNKDKILELAK